MRPARLSASLSARTARTARTTCAALAAAAVVLAGLVVAQPAGAASSTRAAVSGGASLASAGKVPVMTGAGGAVASVDETASQVGISILRSGGDAADAAVAMAATLGVTEPYSSGIGGGGFLVYYDAARRRLSTINSRESAPMAFTPTVFTAADGTALDFNTVVNSGLSVGVPGTLALWDTAARRFGTRSLSQLLAPGEAVARNGFPVDATFAQQSAANAARFQKFPATAALFLPGGQPPAVGSTFRNPDLAATYDTLRHKGIGWFYDGALSAAIVDEARNPSTAPGVDVYAGLVTRADLRRYQARVQAPTHVAYRGLDVYGMAVPSSGGLATGEALNLLEAYDRQTHTHLSQVSSAQYLHRFSEASATAFADRNRWIGDVPGVPKAELLSQGFADERACQLFSPTAAQPRPIAWGQPDGEYGDCPAPSSTEAAARDDHGTTHLVAADRWGNVASYTLTIEQTGGSGITVPGYGFLLNNEMTDFNFVPLTAGVPDPNLPGPGKQPRSSMSPTIVLKDGRPWLALGSPGGATIITTVLQVLTGYVDRGLALVDAIAAPRLSSRNGLEDAEQAFLDSPDAAQLQTLGHVLRLSPEIGAAAAVRIYPNGTFLAAAEPVRRGGGSAMVVNPS
jgi:gamma-glutamyltranspeptidase / glutathione hydrolase